MKLSDIAKKPQLVEVTIDSPEIVETYGEPLTFWTWDRQPMSVFLRLSQVENGNYESIVSAVTDLVLSESGEPVLTNDAALPAKVMLAVIACVVDGLGK